MVECDDLRPWTIARETDRLRSGAAADLEHAAAGRKPRIPMKQANDRGSLRQQALALALAVSMDVHTRESSAGVTPASCTLLQPCYPAPRAVRSLRPALPRMPGNPPVARVACGCSSARDAKTDAAGSGRASRL